MDSRPIAHDANVKMITVNGQTILLEGDFGSVSDDILEEILTDKDCNPARNNSMSHNEFNGMKINGVAKDVLNGCAPVVDRGKIGIAFKGVNNDYEILQINIDEARTLGLYVESELENSAASGNIAAFNGSTNTLLKDNEITPLVNGHATGYTEAEPINPTVIKDEISIKHEVDENGDVASLQTDETEQDETLPAEIAHLEDFQIPTAEDGTLLPATVNAKMADGTYQLLTLIPQIVDGNVTYTVQFADIESNDTEEKSDFAEEAANGEVHLKSTKTNILQSILQSVEKNTAAVTKNSNVYTLNSENNFSFPSHVQQNDSGLNFTNNLELPKQIENKITDLITENENVIAACKKIQYGNNYDKKQLKDSDSLKRNRRVKFTDTSGPEVNDRKRAKLSLLKPILNSEYSRKSHTPFLNLNSRLEYPNLSALEEPVNKVPATKSLLKNNLNKASYYNVVPTSEAKEVKPSESVTPVSCNVEQYKNLLSLQKFLQAQNFQLKIQPMKKVKAIHPKPVTEEEKNNEDLQESTKETPKEVEDVSVKSNVRDALLSEGELDFLPFKNLKTTEKVESKENDVTSKTDGILVKNNPIFFNNKIGKNGKIENKYPLGSTKNPIQLLQTGQTYHSRQPLSESQLKKIASILQKQSFDFNRTSVFDPKTNTRIVYRVIYPEDVELIRPKEKEDLAEDQPKKRGRQKTKALPGDTEMKKSTPNGARGPGRPKIKRTEEEEEENDDMVPKQQVNVKKVARTRSGRLSRPPRYMVKDYKRIHNADITENNAYDSDGGYSDYQIDEAMEKSANLDNTLLPGLRPQPRMKRNFKPEYRCPTCQKIYLGYSKMKRHLIKFPDHCNVEKYEEIYERRNSEPKVKRPHRLTFSEVSKRVKKLLTSLSSEDLISLYGPIFAEALSMWDFILLRINLMKSNARGAVEALLNELSIFLQKLAKIAEDILFPVFTKSSEKDNEYIEIDKMEIGIALGIPTGLYKVNEKNINLLQCPTKAPTVQKDAETTQDKTHEVKQEVVRPDIIFDEFDGPVKESEEPNKDGREEKTIDPSSFLNETSSLTWQQEKVDKSYWNEEERTKSPVNSLATKFEPNLSTKLMESSNESIDDTKYEGALSDPVELIDLDSNSKDIERSTSSENLNIMMKEKEKEPPPPEWDKNKEPPQIWSENSNINAANDKVDETNSQLLESLLSVNQATEFLPNGETSFLDEKPKEDEKGAWNGLWTNKQNWEKEERTPGSRTSGRLTSTPECNGNSTFNIPNRRNSISDFTNINLESNLYEKPKLILPPAETLIKKTDNYNMETNNTIPNNFMDQSESATRDNTDDIMNISLDSLPQHDVIVPPTSFESIGILNQTASNNNLIFPSSEGDGLDFNLSLPEHILRSSEGGAGLTPSFITSSNNLFGATSTISNSLNLQMEQNFDYFSENFVSSNNTNFSQCFPTLDQEFSEKKIIKNVKKEVKNLKKKKKIKKKKVVTNDFPKSTIESIINEALFDSSQNKTCTKQQVDSSHVTTGIEDTNSSYSLPIISDSLDEVGNLDFLNQD